MLGLKREIDQVAKDKGIDAAEIIAALEDAMKQAARRERGQDMEIEARFNEDLGEVELFEFREVVEQVDDDTRQISIEDAHQYRGLNIPVRECGNGYRKHYQNKNQSSFIHIASL